MAKQIKKKTTVKKTATKPAPVMEHKCGPDCPCGCHKHGAGHRVKHIIILLIVFIIGCVCGKMMCFKGKMMMGPVKHHPVFTNGCLDMQSVKCPKMQEMLMTADVNGDNCISIEEYKAQKAANAHKFGKKHKGKMFGHMKNDSCGDMPDKQD